MATKIILVEDDRDSCLLFRHVLISAGYEIAHFFDGKDLLNNSESDCSLYILDNCLPSIDGAAITKYLRTKPETRVTPVLIISGNQSVKDKVKRAGANAFLAKPFEVSLFLQIVSKLVHDPSFNYFQEAWKKLINYTMSSLTKKANHVLRNKLTNSTQLCGRGG